MLSSLDLGDENSHKRYTARGEEKVISRGEIDEFLLCTVFTYQNCTPTMVVGMHTIILNKETY